MLLLDLYSDKAPFRTDLINREFGTLHQGSFWVWAQPMREDVTL